MLQFQNKVMRDLDEFAIMTRQTQQICANLIRTSFLVFKRVKKRKEDEAEKAIQMKKAQDKAAKEAARKRAKAKNKKKKKKSKKAKVKILDNDDIGHAIEDAEDPERDLEHDDDDMDNDDLDDLDDDHQNNSAVRRKERKRKIGGDGAVSHIEGDDDDEGSDDDKPRHRRRPIKITGTLEDGDGNIEQYLDTDVSPGKLQMMAAKHGADPIEELSENDDQEYGYQEEEADETKPKKITKPYGHIHGDEIEADIYG